MYDKDNITTQMKKGILEYMILMIINKWEVYASDIIGLLQSNNLLIVEWTLYPLLSRLKKDWLLAYSRVESPSGPPRKYYKLTTQGKEILQMMWSIRDQLSKTISSIKHI